MIYLDYEHQGLSTGIIQTLGSVVLHQETSAITTEKMD